MAGCTYEINYFVPQIKMIMKSCGGLEWWERELRGSRLGAPPPQMMLLPRWVGPMAEEIQPAFRSPEKLSYCNWWNNFPFSSLWGPLLTCIDAASPVHGRVRMVVIHSRKPRWCCPPTRLSKKTAPPLFCSCRGFRRHLSFKLIIIFRDG